MLEFKNIDKKSRVYRKNFSKRHKKDLSLKKVQRLLFQKNPEAPKKISTILENFQNSRKKKIKDFLSSGKIIN